MSTVVVTITTKKQTVPASPAASATVVAKLMQGVNLKASINIVLPALSGSFSNVADGDYTIVVQRLNVQSQPIGDAVTSSTFTVANTTDIDVPDVVSVSMT